MLTQPQNHLVHDLVPSHKHLHQRRHHLHNHDVDAIRRLHNDQSDGTLQRGLRQQRHTTHNRDINAIGRPHNHDINAIGRPHNHDINAVSRPHNGERDGTPRKRHEHGRSAEFNGCQGRGWVFG